jgi:hypothetical protein
MMRVARKGLPEGADVTGLSSHRRANAAGHPCGELSMFVGVSFMAGVE